MKIKEKKKEKKISEGEFFPSFFWFAPSSVLYLFYKI